MLMCKKNHYCWDLLFVFGLIFCTMTSLRFKGIPIGIGEILLVIWMIKQWVLGAVSGSIVIKKNNNFFLFFWFLFFIFLLFGVLTVVLKGISLPSGFEHDFWAYMFVFFLCISLLISERRESTYNKLKLVSIWGTIIFAILLLWWKNISPNLGRLSLVYGGVRFSGGAINPNQLALFIVPIPALVIFLLNKKSGIYKRIFLVVIFGLSLYVGLSIKSDAIIGTYILMIIFYLILSLCERLKKQQQLLLIFIITIVCFMLFYTSILGNSYHVFVDLFSKLDKDGSRAFLWLKGIKMALETPFVGGGPGARVVLSPIHSMEAHNTFIDLSLQVGLGGLLLYFVMLIKKYLKIRQDKYLLIAFLSIIIFSLSHFVLRQPIFWMYLLLIYSVSFQKENVS